MKTTDSERKPRAVILYPEKGGYILWCRVCHKEVDEAHKHYGMTWKDAEAIEAGNLPGDLLGALDDKPTDAMSGGRKDD